MEKTNQLSDDRRRFMRKLISLAAVSGLAPLLLGERIQGVYAKANVTPEGTHGTFGSFVGADNNNQVWDNYGVITGGVNNTAGSTDDNMTNAAHATVRGGISNTASGLDSNVSGGSYNTAGGDAAAVGGGFKNHASGYAATIGGGGNNTASGREAAVPGGAANQAAGDVSFAAGYRANVNSAHPGAFLFADHSSFDFNSAAANEFAVRATGGFRFVTGLMAQGTRLCRQR